MACYFQHPQTMLGPGALARRARHSIPLQVSDIPVSENYLKEVKATGATVYGASRWFNMAWIQASPQQITSLQKLPFVDHIEVYTPLYAQVTATQKVVKDYGYATAQVEMIHANQLHQLGYTGKDVTICLMDAGFYGGRLTSVFLPAHATKDRSGFGKIFTSLRAMYLMPTGMVPVYCHVLPWIVREYW